MIYKFNDIEVASKKLLKAVSELEDKAVILRHKDLKKLYSNIKNLDAKEKAAYGAEVNKLKNQLLEIAVAGKISATARGSIDVTAPFDINTPADKRPGLFSADKGSVHPLTREFDRIIDIFGRMGFKVEDSRQLDNEYNMFTALNFPGDHPAKDDYDSFLTDEGLIPPSHTSTMQNRILKNNDLPIRAIIPGRTYRNEDVDATHGHTFYQLEGVYVDEGITLADMIGTISTYMNEYFEQDLEYKTQPFYFPFVEPGLEFLVKYPEVLKKPGQTGDKWLELGGCGMIHPNVLKEAGIDSDKYTGFAWGFGIDRMVMLRNSIEDLRHFHTAKLDFLRQF